MKWKNNEINFLIKYYNTFGIEYCIKNLNRSYSSIMCRCNQLNLKLDKSVLSKKLIQSKIKPKEDYNIDVNKFLNIVNPEVAYMLGFLWADGYMSTKWNTIGIKIVRSDMIEIEKIFDFVGKWSKFYNQEKHWKQTANFYTSNYYMHLFLTSVNFNNKSHSSPDKLISLIPEKIKHYFYRGIIDGDGSFYHNAKNNLNQFLISSTFNQDWNYFSNLCQQLNIKYKITRRNHKNSNKTISHSSYVRITNIKDITILGNYIYHNFDIDNIGLKRKYFKYLIIKEKCKM